MESESRHKWIEDVLNSTEGMSRAQPSGKLFASIEQQLNNAREVARKVPMRTVLAAAASVVVLVVANVFILSDVQVEQQRVPQRDETEAIIKYYGLNDNGISRAI